jgi:hypothetical protein
MTPYPLLFFFILFFLFAAVGRRHRVTGRRGISPFTSYGVVFCALSLGLWLLTRMEDILASLDFHGS